MYVGMYVPLSYICIGVIYLIYLESFNTISQYLGNHNTDYSEPWLEEIIALVVIGLFVACHMAGSATEDAQSRAAVAATLG